jgi:energy-coupling factor transport system ATP-binding protein
MPAATPTPGVTEPQVTEPRARRRDSEITFLRLVPGDTFVHRLWAGTKLIVAAELALTASISPTWLSLGVLAGLVALGLLMARIPLGAFPRLPRALYGLLLVGLATNALSTAAPVWHLGPVSISGGALADATRFLLLAVVLITSAALVGWTTPLGAVPPALSRLGTPLRRLRLPVDEWIVAIGLALRCLPLLVDEMRTLSAARRLRHHDKEHSRDARRLVVEVHDIVSTAIIVSLRRARDLGDAIVARGGIRAVGNTQDGERTWRDAVVLVGVTAIAVALVLAPS